MKVTVNLAHLYDTDRALYNQIKHHVDRRISGTETIDVGIAFAEAVKRWQQRNPEELWDDQRKQAERDARKADAAKGVEAAVKQYKVWLQQGLEDTPANSDLVAKWVAANFTHASPYAVDSAIRTLGPGGTRQLAWKAPVAASVEPPPPPPPTPVLIDDPKSPTGQSGQLPLGTTPSTRFSVAQLRDLDRREREDRQKQIRSRNNEVAAAAKANAPVLEVEIV